MRERDFDGPHPSLPLPAQGLHLLRDRADQAGGGRLLRRPDRRRGAECAGEGERDTRHHAGEGIYQGVGWTQRCVVVSSDAGTNLSLVRGEPADIQHYTAFRAVSSFLVFSRLVSSRLVSSHPLVSLIENVSPIM